MATQPRIADRLRFDGFELDVRAGELRKNGIRLRLRGQPIQVLAILLERAGDVVTREELQSRIWPADTFVDFDHGLHNAIARIREVLGDSADSPRYIETLPRRGYRFIGRLEDFPALQLVAETFESGPPPSAAVDRATRRVVLMFAFLCALIAVGLVAWTMHQYGRARAAVTPIRSIAVLPLDNWSGDPSQEFFADGMTDQLITDLAQINSLRVISRTSVMQYKGVKKGLPEIARELKVDAIVEGSVIRSGQRVRVTAQLVQAATDQHLWAKTYDRDLGDILKLQGEVADAIAEQVSAQLTPTQQAQLHGGRAVNAESYDAYLKGRLYFVNEFTKPDSLRTAQHYFEESIQKDPNFALAYAGLADTYVYMAFAGSLQRDQAYRSAKEALAKAVALDDTIGEAHDTLGLLSAEFDWDWDTADREFSRAVALAPSYSCAHEDRASFLALIGRQGEARAEIAKIDQLDFSSNAGWVESAAYIRLLDYPSLIESSKRALLLDPNDGSQHYFLGVGYEGTGRFPEAISEYRKTMDAWGDSRSAVALAHAYAAAGKKDEAEKILRNLEHKFLTTPTPPYDMAAVYAGLGENDKAFEFLERAYAQRPLGLPALLKSDLALDSLRSDPRFRSLVHRVGLSN